MLNRRLFFGFGFLVWLLATIIFRLAGQVFFLTERIAALALLWIVTAIALVIIARMLFRWQGLERAQRFEAAALMVISGMILDAFITEGFATVFPNMPAAAAGSFGAWLLLAYASVIFSAFLPTGADSADTT